MAKAAPPPGRPTWVDEGHLAQIFAANHKARHRLELLVRRPGQLPDGRHGEVLWQGEGGRILVDGARRLAQPASCCRSCGPLHGCPCWLAATSSGGIRVKSVFRRICCRHWSSIAKGGLADAAGQFLCHRLDGGVVKQEGGGQVDAEDAAAGAGGWWHGCGRQLQWPARPRVYCPLSTTNRSGLSN